jgi:hypothetical protein
LRPDEQGLLWTLVHRPVEGLAAVAQLDEPDLEGLLSAPVIRLAGSLGDMPPETLPELLRERLSDGERALLERAAHDDAPAAPAAECVLTIRRERVKREAVLVQDEIDRLQQGSLMDDATLGTLWRRKMELLQQLEALTQGTT